MRQVNGGLQGGAEGCTTAYELLRTYCPYKFTLVFPVKFSHKEIPVMKTGVPAI